MFVLKLKPLFNLSRIGMACRRIQMKIYKCSNAPVKQFLDRNEDLQRPLSPSKIFPLKGNKFLAGLHRGTGLALMSYVMLLALSTEVLSWPLYCYFEDWNSVRRSKVIAVKFALAYPLVFHYLNAVKLLMMDLGYFTEKTKYKQAGYLVAALALLFSALLSLKVVKIEEEKQEEPVKVPQKVKEGGCTCETDPITAKV